MKKEIASTSAPGILVDVDGHSVHVYTEGGGQQTIVFLSGAGTSAPMLDFKPLWSALSPAYSIAVVEKAGYGWSEIADVSRQFEVDKVYRKKEINEEDILRVISENKSFHFLSPSFS